MQRAPHPTILALLALLIATGVAAAGEFVGIPDQDFATHYRPQRASMWCWASCVEMALSYAGIEWPQERIVASRQGEGANIGGLPADLVSTASGRFLTISGEEALVSSRFLDGPPSADLLYDHLRRRAPAILLYERADGQGHAVVLTGIEVAVDAAGILDLKAFHVFDPSLGAIDEDAAEGDPLACRRVYPAQRTETGISIPTGNIDGVVLVDSTRREARTTAGP